MSYNMDGGSIAPEIFTFTGPPVPKRKTKGMKNKKKQQSNASAAPLQSAPPPAITQPSQPTQPAVVPTAPDSPKPGFWEKPPAFCDISIKDALAPIKRNGKVVGTATFSERQVLALASADISNLNNDDKAWWDDKEEQARKRAAARRAKYAGNKKGKGKGKIVSLSQLRLVALARSPNSAAAPPALSPVLHQSGRSAENNTEHSSQPFRPIYSDSEESENESEYHEADCDCGCVSASDIEAEQAAIRADIALHARPKKPTITYSRRNIINSQNNSNEAERGSKRQASAPPSISEPRSVSEDEYAGSDCGCEGEYCDSDCDFYPSDFYASDVYFEVERPDTPEDSASPTRPVLSAMSTLSLSPAMGGVPCSAATNSTDPALRTGSRHSTKHSRAASPPVQEPSLRHISSASTQDVPTSELGRRVRNARSPRSPAQIISLSSESPPNTSDRGKNCALPGIIPPSNEEMASLQQQDMGRCSPPAKRRRPGAPSTPMRTYSKRIESSFAAMTLGELALQGGSNDGPISFEYVPQSQQLPASASKKVSSEDQESFLDKDSHAKMAELENQRKSLEKLLADHHRMEQQAAAIVAETMSSPASSYLPSPPNSPPPPPTSFDYDTDDSDLPLRRPSLPNFDIDSDESVSDYDGTDPWTFIQQATARDIMRVERAGAIPSVEMLVRLQKSSRREAFGAWRERIRSTQGSRSPSPPARPTTPTPPASRRSPIEQREENPIARCRETRIAPPPPRRTPEQEKEFQAVIRASMKKMAELEQETFSEAREVGGGRTSLPSRPRPMAQRAAAPLAPAPMTAAQQEAALQSAVRTSMLHMAELEARAFAEVHAIAIASRQRHRSPTPTLARAASSHSPSAAPPQPPHDSPSSDDDDDDDDDSDTPICSSPPPSTTTPPHPHPPHLESHGHYRTPSYLFTTKWCGWTRLSVAEQAVAEVDRLRKTRWHYGPECALERCGRMGRRDVSSRTSFVCLICVDPHLASF